MSAWLLSHVVQSFGDYGALQVPVSPLAKYRAGMAPVEETLLNYLPRSPIERFTGLVQRVFCAQMSS